MDKIIKRIKCLFFGHEISVAQCPFTKAKLETCTRCDKGNSAHGKGMSFH